MPDTISRPSTAFAGHRLLRRGPLAEVALAVKARTEDAPTETVLVFDDTTGAVIDLDLRGSEADIVGRLAGPEQATTPSAEPDREGSSPAPKRRGPGRPKLGVVAREVTLLPRHWEWLAAQPSGASAALRRLVDEARRRTAPQHRRRTAQEAAYRFMLAIGGDLPDFEEATRALFADDREALAARTAAWPDDVRDHTLRLAFPTPTSSDPAPEGATP